LVIYKLRISEICSYQLHTTQDHDKTPVP